MYYEIAANARFRVTLSEACNIPPWVTSKLDRGREVVKIACDSIATADIIRLTIDM